jgi:hypothetical protein
MQAVVSAAHAAAAEQDEEQEQQQEQQAARAESLRSLPRRMRAAGNGRKLPPGLAPPLLPTSSPAGWSDADDDTSPLPRLTASGAVASAAADSISAQADRATKPGSAQVDRSVKPDRPLRRDRQAAKRERAALRERERAAEQERARQEQERAAQQERQRAAERERLQAAERERQLAAERERQLAAEREQERQRAAQQERERTAELDRERQRAAELERERRRAAERDRARQEQERAAEGERQRLEEQERQRADRDRQRAAQREPDRSAQPERQRLAAAAPTDLLEHPRPSVRKFPGRRRYRPAVLVASAVVVAAGSLAIVMSSHGSKQTPHGPGQAVAAPVLAAAWVAHQVSRTATVACDPVMCRALQAHGVDRLLIVASQATGPLRSQVIIATPAVRNELGARLSSVYAPAVIASFGSGSARIDIRVTAQHGAAAYRSLLRQDVAQRKAIGGGLIGSTFSTRIIVPSATARKQLATGQVESRLLYTIENLAGRHPIRILAFGDSGPGASAGMPLRSAEVIEAGSAADVSSPAGVQVLLAIVRTQGHPYVPAFTQTTRLAGQTVLLIEFAAPSPLLLLNPPS